VTLETLRSSFVAEALAEADRTRHTAHAERRARLDEARRQAREIVAEGRRSGERDAAVEVGQRCVRARRDARRMALAARAEVLEEFHRRAVEAAQALREGPGYAGLLDRLAAAARAQLGPAAQLEIDPPAGGGVVARAGTLLVDYTLPALAERCIAALGPDLQRLWAEPGGAAGSPGDRREGTS
jgi:vacuolar-type H+-ATPase subunit E/Vma4